MEDFTLLSVEQCFGPDKLELLDLVGLKAAITDFAILLGGFVSKDCHVWKDNSPAGRTGWYWILGERETNTGFAIDYDGSHVVSTWSARTGGGRIALPFSSVSEISMQANGRVKSVNGIKEVEYGYYPGQAVNTEMQAELEQELVAKRLVKTGKAYTTDSVKYDEFNTKFRPQRHEEYEYKGKKYVRVKVITDSFDSVPLSNGMGCENGDVVWVEVEPVKWLIDEKSKVMITEKILFAGVQYSSKTFVNFGKTDMKMFIDKYFAKELMQEKNIEMQNLSNNFEWRQKEKNPYEFDFEETTETEIIENAIKSNVSIFLHGKPGCGKSDRVKQLDPDFIELNLSHLDPELLDGLAGERDGKAVHIKPPWLEELEEKCEEEPDKIHILFLEELTNASPIMQAKAYGIALDKKVAGKWKLPEQARVVAAGNELGDSLAANELAEPLYDRFAHINIETTAENWLKWAATPDETYRKLDYEEQKDKDRPKIHPAIYAYVSYKEDEVLRTPYDRENPEPHADPRRWKMASDMLYESNKPWTLESIIGEDLTRDFIEFCQTPTISVEDVIKGNYNIEILKKFDLSRQLATVISMLKVDSKNMPIVRDFIRKNFGEEMCRKFESQWTHGNEERLEQLCELQLEEQLQAKYARDEEEK